MVCALGAVAWPAVMGYHRGRRGWRLGRAHFLVGGPGFSLCPQATESSLSLHPYKGTSPTGVPAPLTLISPEGPVF